MSKIKRSSFTVPTPDSYVRSVLRHIGQSCGAAGTGELIALPPIIWWWTQQPIDRPATLTAYPSHAIADYLVHAVSNVFSNSVCHSSPKLPYAGVLNIVDRSSSGTRIRYTNRSANVPSPKPNGKRRRECSSVAGRYLCTQRPRSAGPAKKIVWSGHHSPYASS